MAGIFGGPTVMLFTMGGGPPVAATDIDQLKESLNAVTRAASISNTILGISLVITAICFVYCYILWAASFVGPREEAD